MGDEGDLWKAVKAQRAKDRAEHGIDCPGCIANHPKRIPTRLLPQQRCRVCGYKDGRSRMEVGK